MRLSDTSIALSLPYNHDGAYPEWLEAHSEAVREVYLPIHRAFAPTARPWTGPANPADYRVALCALAAVLRKLNVDANVVVNLLVPWEARSGVVQEIQRLQQEVFEDLLTVAVSDFQLALSLRERLPELRLSVSTTAEVDSAERAAYWVDSVGVASICVARSINKKLDRLRAIRALGVQVKVVLDDCCGIACPAILSHAALSSSEGERSGEQRCFARDYVRRRPWLIALKDIVPATLPRYEGIVDFAKPDGRTVTLEKIERKWRLYCEAESWQHPASLYDEPAEAFERLTVCDRNCSACRWCEEHFAWHWDKLLGPEES